MKTHDCRYCWEVNGVAYCNLNVDDFVIPCDRASREYCEPYQENERLLAQTEDFDYLAKLHGLDY